MEPVGDAELGHAADDVLEHVAAASHHEADVAGLSEYLGRRLDEVVRSLLVGDPAEEGDDLVAYASLLRPRVLG